MLISIPVKPEDCPEHERARGSIVFTEADVAKDGRLAELQAQATSAILSRRHPVIRRPGTAKRVRASKSRARPR